MFLVAALMVSAPRVFSAPPGGLGDKIKVLQAMKELTNTAKKEVEKKIKDAVDNKPISETDKANIKKTLLGVANSMVDKFIEGVGAGKLPERVEVVNVVMKDILPQLDKLVAEIEETGNKDAAVSPLSVPAPSAPSSSSTSPSLVLPPPSAPSAPSAPPAPPVSNQRVAVYATGGIDVTIEIKKSVVAGILNALVDSRHYAAIEKGEDFFAEVSALRTVQIDNTVYDSQISEIGAKFSVNFVCVVEIATTSNAFHLLTRMIDVKTAEAVSVGNAFSLLKSDDDIAVVSGELVKKMAGRWVELPPEADIANAPSGLVIPDEDEPVPPAPQPVAPDSIPTIAETETKVHHTGVSKGPLAAEPDDLFTIGFSLGYGLSQDAESKSDFLTLGLVYTSQISENNDMLFNVEGNFVIGVGKYKYRYYDGSEYRYAHSNFNFFSADVPLTVMYPLSVFLFEVGVHGNVLFGDGATLFDAGFVAGVGVMFDEKRVRRYFYRYNSGLKYGTHEIGVSWLFF